MRQLTARMRIDAETENWKGADLGASAISGYESKIPTSFASFYENPAMQFEAR
jgi:hypothetical protein